MSASRTGDLEVQLHPSQWINALTSDQLEGSRNKENRKYS